MKKPLLTFLAGAVVLSLQSCNTPVDIVIDNPNPDTITLSLDKQQLKLAPGTAIVHRMIEGQHVLKIDGKEKEFTLSSPEHDSALLNPTERIYVLKENVYQLKGDNITIRELNKIRTTLNKRRQPHEQFLLNDTIDFHGLYVTSGFLLKVGDLLIPKRWHYGLDEKLPPATITEFPSGNMNVIVSQARANGYLGDVKLYRTNDYVEEMFGNSEPLKPGRWSHITGASLLDSEESKAFVAKFNLRTEKSTNPRGAYLFNDKILLHFWLDAGYLMCDYYDLKNLRWNANLDSECLSGGVIPQKDFGKIYKRHENETKDGEFPAPLMASFKAHIEVLSRFMPDFMEGDLKRYNKFMRGMEEYHRNEMEQFNITHSIAYEKNDPLQEDQGSHKIEIKPELVVVKGGTFTMGVDAGRTLDSEKPPHQVTVSTFNIGKFEITVGQYKAFCNATGKGMPEAPRWGWVDKHPMVNVTHPEAMEYCRWLSEKFGGHWRLPTEAEWEFAARGGNLDRKYQYSGSNEIKSVAWYLDNSVGRTHPVGLRKNNELGMYDMSGNAFEWVSDWYTNYSAQHQVNPKGPATGAYRTIRGGAWNNSELGTQRRSASEPDSRSHGLGFRVARDTQ